MERSIVDQVRQATQKQNRLATGAGFTLGGFVPSAVFSIVHYELKETPLLWIIVLGGLLFSAITVFRWSKIAFDSGVKAVGFVVLIEGVMTFSGLYWLSCTALALLIVINGIATGCNLALNRRETAAEERAVAKPLTPPVKKPVAKRAAPRRKSVRVNFNKGKKKKAS